MFSYPRYFKEIISFALKRTKELFDVDEKINYKALILIISQISGVGFAFLVGFEDIAIGEIILRVCITLNGVIIFGVVFVINCLIAPYNIISEIKNHQLEIENLRDSIRLGKIIEDDYVGIEVKNNHPTETFIGRLYLINIPETDDIRNPILLQTKEGNESHVDIPSNIWQTFILASKPYNDILEIAGIIGIPRDLPFGEVNLITKLSGTFTNIETPVSIESYWRLRFSDEDNSLQLDKID